MNLCYYCGEPIPVGLTICEDCQEEIDLFEDDPLNDDDYDETVY